MALCIIELNDSEIRVAQGANIILRSPGYAVINKKKLELGEAAAKLARLNPRTTYTKFWANLNQDSLQNPSDQVRHNADLAYAHLIAIHEQAGKPEEVIFAVPGFYSNEQLSILLGLVEASPFTAIGLVDSAIAASVPIVGTGDYIHVDIHLHQTVLTNLNVADDVSRASVHVVDNTGLSAIYDACALLISDLFINQSRFDPQHHAETEQALYNQIPECLLSLKTHNEVVLEIQFQDTQHQAKLLKETLLKSLQPLYDKIINSITSSNTCLISERLSNLPGFVEQLPETEVLDAASVFRGCQEHALHIKSSGPALNFITRLPITSNPTITAITKQHSPAQPTTINTSKQAITHILHAHSAYPLNNGHLFLSSAGNTNPNKTEDSHCSVVMKDGHVIAQTESGLTVYINGQQLNQSSEVTTGDIISFAGSKTEYTFISVMN